MSWIRVAILCGVAAIVGCSDAGEQVKPPDTTAKDAVKKALEGVAKSGQGGSELGAMMNDLQKLKETDQAVAEELISDVTALMSEGNPDQIKAKAQEMLKKLEGAKGG